MQEVVKTHCGKNSQHKQNNNRQTTRFNLSCLIVAGCHLVFNEKMHNR
jgi:hypothetical protein